MTESTCAGCGASKGGILGHYDDCPFAKPQSKLADALAQVMAAKADCKGKRGADLAEARDAYECVIAEVLTPAVEKALNDCDDAKVIVKIAKLLIEAEED